MACHLVYQTTCCPRLQFFVSSASSERGSRSEEHRQEKRWFQMKRIEEVKHDQQLAILMDYRHCSLLLLEMTYLSAQQTNHCFCFAEQWHTNGMVVQIGQWRQTRSPDDCGTLGFQCSGIHLLERVSKGHQYYGGLTTSLHVSTVHAGVLLALPSERWKSRQMRPQDLIYLFYEEKKKQLKTLPTSSSGASRDKEMRPKNLEN